MLPLATQEQFRDYLGDETAVISNLTLTRASRVVRAALIGFTPYETDADGIPTDPAIAATLAEAVCAQCDYWDEAGETGTGADEGITSASILGVSYSRSAGPGSGMSTGSTRSLCGEAFEVLMVGGMLFPSVAY